MTFALRITAELGQLFRLRQFVEEAAASLQLPHTVTEPLVLAVDELAVNIIQHGYRGRPGPIEVEIERTKDAVIARLRDQAPPFDPTRLPEPNLTLPLEQRPEGGLGVYLARRAVDSLSYEITDQGSNQVTLVKKTAVP